MIRPRKVAYLPDCFRNSEALGTIYGTPTESGGGRCIPRARSLQFRSCTYFRAERGIIRAMDSRTIKTEHARQIATRWARCLVISRDYPRGWIRLAGPLMISCVNSYREPPMRYIRSALRRIISVAGVVLGGNGGKSCCDPKRETMVSFPENRVTIRSLSCPINRQFSESKKSTSRTMPLARPRWGPRGLDPAKMFSWEH